MTPFLGIQKFPPGLGPWIILGVILKRRDQSKNGGTISFGKLLKNWINFSIDIEIPKF